MNKDTQKHNAETLALKLLDTASALERQLDSALSFTRGISFSEYRLISTLAAAGPNGLPRVELANAVHLTPSAVTRALRPLEKTGYVTTQKSERDARQSLARITKGGRTLLADAQQVLLDVYRQLPVSSTEEEQADEIIQVLKQFRTER